MTNSHTEAANPLARGIVYGLALVAPFWVAVALLAYGWTH